MSQKPRILMIAPQCYPPVGPEAIVTAKLLLTFMKAGWEADVIGQAESGQFYPADPKGGWAPLQRIVHNIDPGFAKHTGSGDGLFDRGFFDRLFLRSQSISWAIKAVLAARKLAAEKRYDAIMSRVAPPYGHIPALILSNSSELPWIANWSDPMPSQKAPPPYGNGPEAAVPALIRGYISSVVGKADWHTFPNERLRRYMCSYLSGLESKSSVVPHVALDSFSSCRPSDRSVFTLCHIGELRIRKPDVFLAGMRLFLDRKKPKLPVCIQFVGLGLGELAQKVEALHLQDVVKPVGAKTYEEAQEIAAASSVLVVIEARCQEGIFLPSKVVDFVQTGRPILAVSPPIGVLSDLLAGTGGGVAASCLSAESVAGAVATLYDAWKAGELDERYGSQALLGEFSEQRVLTQYQEILFRVGERKHRETRR